MPAVRLVGEGGKSRAAEAGHSKSQLSSPINGTLASSLPGWGLDQSANDQSSKTVTTASHRHCRSRYSKVTSDLESVVNEWTSCSFRSFSLPSTTYQSFSNTKTSTHDRKHDSFIVELSSSILLVSGIAELGYPTSRVSRSSPGANRQDVGIGVCCVFKQWHTTSR